MVEIVSPPEGNSLDKGIPKREIAPDTILPRIEELHKTDPALHEGKKLNAVRTLLQEETTHPSHVHAETGDSHPKDEEKNGVVKKTLSFISKWAERTERDPERQKRLEQCKQQLRETIIRAITTNQILGIDIYKIGEDNNPDLERYQTEEKLRLINDRVMFYNDRYGPWNRKFVNKAKRLAEDIAIYLTATISGHHQLIEEPSELLPEYISNGLNQLAPLLSQLHISPDYQEGISERAYLAPPGKMSKRAELERSMQLLQEQGIANIVIAPKSQQSPVIHFNELSAQAPKVINHFARVNLDLETEKERLTLLLVQTPDINQFIEPQKNGLLLKNYQSLVENPQTSVLFTLPTEPLVYFNEAQTPGQEYLLADHADDELWPHEKLLKEQLSRKGAYMAVEGLGNTQKLKVYQYHYDPDINSFRKEEVTDVRQIEVYIQKLADNLDPSHSATSSTLPS